MSELKCTMFDDEEYNALGSALIEASEAEDIKDNEKIYEFLDLPKTSLIVKLLQALHQMGYEINKKEE